MFGPSRMEVTDIFRKSAIWDPYDFLLLASVLTKAKERACNIRGRKYKFTQSFGWKNIKRSSHLVESDMAVRVMLKWISQK